MANVAMTLSFAGQPLAALPRFNPASEVRGNVWVTTDQNVQCHHLWVKLQWFTHGKGDRDQGVVGQQDIFQGTLQAGLPLSYEFVFALPQAPWSYAGHYINISWEVQVQVDLGLFNKPKKSLTLIMAPEPAAIAPAIPWA